MQSSLDNAQTCQTLQGTSINRPRAGLRRRATSVGKASRHGRAWQVEGADKDLGVGPVCNETKDYSGEAWWFKAAFLLACKGRSKRAGSGRTGVSDSRFLSAAADDTFAGDPAVSWTEPNTNKDGQGVYKRSMTAPPLMSPFSVS